MRSLPAIFLLVFLNGCAGLNIDPPERWVEGNVLYSTKLPSVGIMVIPSLIYQQAEEDSKFKPSVTSPRITWEDSQGFFFLNKPDEKRLIVKFQSLHDNNFHQIKADFSKNDKAFISASETISGINFATGVLVRSSPNKNKAILGKIFDTVVGQTIRFRIIYEEIVDGEWLRKRPQLLDTVDRDFLIAFEQRANESFSIIPYGRNVPSSKQF